MNLIFGTTREPSPPSPDRLAGLAESFGEARALGSAEGADWDTWTVSDDGALSGRAEEDGVCLAYVGIFPRRLPGWGDGSPLDDPDATARFLLSRYRQQDLAFLDGIPGQYALLVQDPAKQRLLLASDATGGRRFFLYRNGPRLAFATKIGVLPRLLGKELSVDRTLEDFLLGFEFLPWGRTFYEGVNILPGGTLFERREGKFTEHPIAPPAATRLPEEMSLDDEASVLDALEGALVEALEDQSPSAQRVGVLLGGFDSALVASLLTRAGKEVETFSFHFDEAGYDQPLVEDLAEHLGIRHHWVRITPEVVQEGLAHFSERFNQPASQPHYLIHTAQVCRVMRREGITHCFSGDGCDGLFLGYPTVYRRARLIDRLSVLPRWVLNLGLAVSSLPGLERLLGHPYRLGRNVLTILKRPMPTRAHIASRIFDELSLARLRQGDSPEQSAQPEAILTQLAQGLEGMSPVRLAYRGKGSVGLNKSKMEGAADLNGTAIQTPFAHPKVVTLAKSLPETFSRPDTEGASQAIGKYILSKMAEEKNLLPKEIIYQAKRSPVHAPVDSWYHGPLREFLLSTYERLPFEASPGYVRGLLREKLAEKLYRKHISLGDLALHGAALLSTYASFTGLVRDD